MEFELTRREILRTPIPYTKVNRELHYFDWYRFVVQQIHNQLNKVELAH